MNHWIDQRLKRWGHWYQIRMLDRSMGWPSTSPITRFGMPSHTGNVWGTSCESVDWSDCESMHQIVILLNPGETSLLLTYYVHTGCSYRKTGRAIGATHKTIKAWLDLVLQKIDRILGDASVRAA